MRHEKYADQFEDQKGACDCDERIGFIGIGDIQGDISVDHPGDAAAGAPETRDVSETAGDGKAGEAV